jgi:type IX secretion system PorP/SprF family membrane protein
MKKIYFATLLFLLSAGAVHSQQQQLLSLYQFYKQGFNPGYIGQNGPFQAVMDYRNQWVRSEGAPESINLGVDGLFGYKRGSYRHAIGAIFSGDKIGVSTENRLGLQYAYRLPVSKSSTLSFGVQVAYQQSRHEFNTLLAADAGDALAEERVTNNEILPGAGFYLNGNRYFAGISIPNLIKDTKDLEGNDVALNRFRHLYFDGRLCVQTISIRGSAHISPFQNNEIGKWEFTRRCRHQHSTDILSAISNWSFIPNRRNCGSHYSDSAHQKPKNWIRLRF